jgi:hypothetical protein
LFFTLPVEDKTNQTPKEKIKSETKDVSAAMRSMLWAKST